MQSVRIFSASEQVAIELRKYITSGELQGSIPGVARLSKMLGINPKTVVPALQILEAEGLVINQGPGKKRLVNSKSLTEQQTGAPPQLRLGFFLYEPSDRQFTTVTEIDKGLHKHGHSVFYPDKTLTELSMDLTKVQNNVREGQCDAWIVSAGSREILEWFSEQSMPSFALFGRRGDLPMPSVSTSHGEALAEGVEQLLSLGHRKIVMISRSERRSPTLGLTESIVLERLANHGIEVGDYNCPAWTETAEGLQELLHSLFQLTPPTALILGDPSFLAAILQFLGGKGIQVPRDLSLISTNSESFFEWCYPSLAHSKLETETVIQRTLQWVANVAQHREDHERTIARATFQMGQSIGPAPQQ